jgi:hypothetical protein
MSLFSNLSEIGRTYNSMFSAIDSYFKESEEIKESNLIPMSQIYKEESEQAELQELRETFAE